MMHYGEAWRFLDDLQFFKIKLGLDSMQHFLGKVDNPQDQLAMIHVGGTNGKGSVAATLLAILTAAGYRVGLYTSPHLSSVRERFRVGDTFIPEEDFARHASRIRAVLENRQITYFEFTTTLALLWFLEQQVDLAIMEVGLGGRLDATNVITPLVAVITNVAMDHEAYLGHTLAAIAHEKAGIIKGGVPAVCGARDDLCRQIITDTCRERGAPLDLLGRDFFCREEGGTMTYEGLDRQGQRWRLADLRLRLPGRHQQLNAACALRTIELLRQQGYAITSEAIVTGLVSVRWPGRLEEFTIAAGASLFPDGDEGFFCRHALSFLLDGAHNPAGAETLAAYLAEYCRGRRLIFVLGAMADKDLQSSLAMIAPLADIMLCTTPPGAGRSAPPEMLVAALPEKTRTRAIIEPDPRQALRRAAAMAQPNDLICITGSLYLIGACRLLLLGEIA